MPPVDLEGGGGGFAPDVFPPTPATVELIDAHLEHHMGFDAAELVTRHPPQWMCKNKRLVYGLSCPDGAASFHGRLEYSRWQEFPLPRRFRACDMQEMEIELHSDVFDYVPPDDDSTVHWYMNFADGNVFGYYRGNLYAQDEAQCLEHPALCSLRESLSHVPSAATRTTVRMNDQTRATPILVRGVERRAMVKTDRNSAEGRPAGLYGNQFAVAPPEAVRSATTVFDQRLDARGRPYYSNIIAMEAPKYGSGHYTDSTVRRIMATAYSGFLAARLESLVELGLLQRSHHPNDDHTTIVATEAKPKPRVIVHTGNWGTGAYGGSILVMSCLQFAAARLAGVDKLVYHSAGASWMKQVEIGHEVYRRFFDAHTNDVDVDTYVDNIVKQKWEWGFSNGT